MTIADLSVARSAFVFDCDVVMGNAAGGEPLFEIKKSWTASLERAAAASSASRLAK